MYTHTYNIRNRKINNITAKYGRLNALKYTFKLSHPEDKDIYVIHHEIFKKRRKIQTRKKFI